MTTKIQRRVFRQAVRTTTGEVYESRVRVILSREKDEDGATLILALVFLVTVGMIASALLGWLENGLLNTSNFKTARSAVYAAGGATDVAIWNSRYSFTSGTTACAGTSPSINLNGVYIEDWCSTTSTASSRIVTISACKLTQTQAGTGLSTACANPILQAKVTYNDYNDSNVDACISATVEGSCGTAMTLDSWVVK
jgi:hypothetical protein